MEALTRLTSDADQREPEPAEPELPAWARKVEAFPQVDPVVLLGLAPVAFYLLFDNFVSVRAAIGASVVSAIIVFAVQRRLRPKARVVFLISMLGMGLMIIFGVVGLIWDDGSLFWASDPVDDFLTCTIFLGSVLIGRPIVGPFVRELFPALADRLPGEHRVWRTITIVWGLKMLATGLLRLWLLDTIEADTYVWIRTLIAWPINLALFLWTLRMIRGTMDEVALQRMRPASALDSDDAAEVVADTELRER